MEIHGLAPLHDQVRNATIVAYSILVAITIVPSFHNIPSVILMPYYLLVPGYCVVTLIGKKEPFVERVFFSVCWSLAIIASIVAINSLKLASLPLNATIPIVAVFILAVVHHKTRK